MGREGCHGVGCCAFSVSDSTRIVTMTSTEGGTDDCCNADDRAYIWIARSHLARNFSKEYWYCGLIVSCAFYVVLPGPTLINPPALDVGHRVDGPPHPAFNQVDPGGGVRILPDHTYRASLGMLGHHVLVSRGVSIARFVRVSNPCCPPIAMSASSTGLTTPGSGRAWGSGLQSGSSGWSG